VCKKRTRYNDRRRRLLLPSGARAPNPSTAEITVQVTALSVVRRTQNDFYLLQILKLLILKLPLYKYIALPFYLQLSKIFLMLGFVYFNQILFKKKNCHINSVLFKCP
jgi:hypothetical protein